MRCSLRLLLFLWAIVAVPAFAQNFDLQRDGMPLAELKGQFRFHAGDDARWADPGFNDSNWSLLKSDQSWYDQGYKNYSGFGWYRFRVTVPAGQKNLAIFIPAMQDSYAIYANGRLIGHLGEFPPHSKLMYGSNLVFPIPPDAVPASRAIVFAVRVWRWPLWGMFPGAGFDASPVFGDAAAVGRWTDLQIHDRFWSSAGFEFLNVVNIAGLLLGFILFLVRPSEREYLWYGLAQTFWSLNSCAFIASHFVQVPTIPFYCCGLLGFFAGNFLNLILFHALLRQRRGLLFWVGGISILFPIVYLVAIFAGLTSFGNFDQAYGLCLVPYTIAIALLMYRAARRGNREAWILFAPFTISTVLIIWSEAAYVFSLERFPAVSALDHFLRNMITWPIRVGTDMSVGTACNLAICLVLILRFARSRRDEERLSAELEAARVVQHVLIPDELPTVPGYLIESVYKPAGQVGGDFFQIIALEHGGALIVIGDVSGKGMPAAMTVSLLVGTFRTLAHYTQSPAEILAAMNTRMLARSQGGFTTCLVLRLDADGALTAANAGHIAPYMDGREIEVVNGLPLGLVPGAEYAETITSLSAGSHLTLLTDGVIEARNPRGELFGFDRARELSTHSAEQVAKAAQLFGQEDDITVLSVNLAPAAVLSA
ncbi:MAG TPA: SpoIIE family protein phosphatase [Terracidiphilus sp.]|jgi:hypothetical protein|nr:SpoIIE family protein phosphatase [Terracidiphilus sp.]